MLKKLFLVMLAALILFALPVGAQEEVLELDEVVVTASRYEESIMDTPVSIEVISQEEIEESTASNLAELLRDAGGVHIKDKGGLVLQKDVLIRGARQDQILYLIDGQPYNSPQDGVIRLEDIPISIIERIEVLKSSGSSIYGANALGGVINIITKDAGDLKETTVDLGIGSYDTRKFNISTAYNWDKASFLFSYDNLRSDTHRDDPDQESALNRDNYFIKYGYDISDRTSLNLSFKHNSTESDYPGSDGPDDYGSRDDQDNNISLSLNQNLKEKDRALTIYNNDRNLYDLTAGGWETDIEIDKRGINLNETNYSFDSHILNYGLEITEDKVTDNTTDTDNVQENINKALFIQDNFSLNDKNTIIYGARYDDHEEYGSQISPRIGYIYNINKNLNLNLSAGESFRAPTFQDLYGSGGNEDLEPEMSRNYEIGLKYLDELCRRELVFFRRDITDMIEYQGEPPTGEMVNIDSASINGAELLAERKFFEVWELGLSYTYLDAEDDDTGEQLTDMPYHDLNFNLSYLLENGKIALNNRYLGERKDYNGDSPSHFVSDLKISSSLTENTDISFEVKNLFDEEYEVVIGYPMPGRNFMVNLSTKF
ncbi:MAG: TonB-dependent receptor plug domain-containing protein [Halanaerobium sp.]